MELLDQVNGFTFVLASKSPRRQEIFKALGLPFRIDAREVDEDFPEHLESFAISEYLALKKANAQKSDLGPQEILITADTIVWINNHVLNKPMDILEAATMLREISGTSQVVCTSVCLTSRDKQHVFTETTRVDFHPLTEREIQYYLSHYKPLDKAGAYGIQEFIGYIGIQAVHGDFYNVVGFPVQRFWKELNSFLSTE